jgi:hypothetical protein
MALQPIFEPCPPLYWGFLITPIRHTVELLWTSDQLVAEACNYTGQHIIYIQQTNFHALSGIRTRDSSNQAAAYLRLKPRSLQALIERNYFPLCNSCSLYSTMALQGLPSVASELCRTAMSHYFVTVFKGAT